MKLFVLAEHLYVICPYLLAVLSSEYFVDWIKHAFITKFNNIPVEVCSELLCFLMSPHNFSNGKNKVAYEPSGPMDRSLFRFP